MQRVHQRGSSGGQGVIGEPVGGWRNGEQGGLGAKEKAMGEETQPSHGVHSEGKEEDVMSFQERREEEIFCELGAGCSVVDPLSQIGS